MKYLTVYINNYAFLSLLFSTMFQFCLSKNIYVPRFCYHNLLNIAGNCRICLLESKQSLKLVVSCATSLINGLSLYTKTKAVKKARESVLEQLLINHPLDCPICDQGGECDLQDQTMVFGGDKTRFYEFKKKSIENKNFGPTIKMFLNRCIYCGRCTRFLNDLSSNYSLKMLGRGSSMEISLYTLEKYNHDFLLSNVIDLCPVGALLSKPYSFLARPWEIVSNKAISLLDSLGSNIQVDYQGTLILRILPKTNSFLNEDWACDKSRFFFDSLVTQRLIKPILFFNNKFFDFNWTDYFKIIYYFYYKNINYNKNNNLKIFNTKFNLGSFLSFDLILLLKIFSKKLGSLNFFSFKRTQNFNNDFRYNYLSKVNSYYWKNLDFGIIINSNPRFENPILQLKLRTSSKIKNFIYYYSGFLSNLNLNYFYLGNNFANILKIFEFYYISLKNLNSILLLLGSNFFNFIPNLNLFFKNLSYNFNFYFLHLFVTNISLSELNISNKKFNYTSQFVTNFFIGLDDFETNYISNFKNNLTIYQGHHGDYSSLKSNIILPTKSFIEKSSFYLNLEGWLQHTGFLLYRYDFEKIKNDFNIFSALSEIFFNKFTIPKIFIKNFFKNINNFKNLIDNILNKVFFNNKFSLKNLQLVLKNSNLKSTLNNLNFSSYFRFSSILQKFYFVENDFYFLSIKKIV